MGATATAARRAVHAGEGRIYLVDTVLMVEAADRAALHERIEAIRLEGRALGLELDVPTFRLVDAWRSVLPGPGAAAPRRAQPRLRLARGLPAPCRLGPLRARGHLVGRIRSSGAPIVLDRFAHASHNAIVLGQTGTGKTMLTGAEMSRCLIRGIRVLAVDPLGDYRRLAAELGGTYLDLGAPGVAINPFAFTGAVTDGALTAKISGLTRLAAAMAGGLTREERPALDHALRGAYAAAGIGPDPATLDRTPPTLADLVAQLAAHGRWGAAGPPARALGERIARAPVRRRHGAPARPAAGGHRPRRARRPRGARGRPARGPRDSCGTPCAATSRPSSSSSTRPGR